MNNTFPSYVVKASYHISTNCEEYGCDDICRCGKIEDLEIKSVNFNDVVSSFYNMCYGLFSGLKNKRILHAVINSVCFRNQLHKKENWKTAIYYGYYGDEFQVELDEKIAEKVKLDIESLVSPDTNKTVENLLAYEYGYITEAARGLKWKLKTIAVKGISVPLNDRLNGETLDLLRASYKEDQSSFVDGMIHCIVIDIGSTGHRLIDGRHRLKVITENNIPTVKALVGYAV